MEVSAEWFTCHGLTCSGGFCAFNLKLVARKAEGEKKTERIRGSS